MTQAVQEMKSKETLRQEVGDLYDKYGPIFYRAAKSITGNREDAEDALHNAFVKLIDKEPAADFDRNPQGYLYRAVVNEALRIFGSRDRERQHLVDEDVTELNIADPTDQDAAKHVEDMDRRLMVARAKLDPYLAVMLTLRYDLKLSCEQIAKLLRRTRMSIYVTMKRAERALSQLIMNEEGAQ